MLKSLLVASAICSLSLSTLAFSAPHPTPMSKKACLTIATACEDAGYRLSDTPGKNVWRDCLRPVVAGKTVSGVTASAAEIKDCKAHEAVWQKKFGSMTKQMDE
jgi:hypothetical protein